MQRQVAPRKIRNIQADVRGQTYRELMRAAQRSATTMYCVVRDEMALSARAEEVLARLQSRLVSSERVRSWPGTTLLDGEATCLEYGLDVDVVNVVAGAADGLFDWRQPELPEDIGFRRSDRSVWMGSVAHESDAFFEVSDEELADLLCRVPGLAECLERT